MFSTSAPRITVRFVALLTAVSLVLSAFPAAFFVANAEEPVPPAEAPAIETPVEEAKVTVCHSAGQSGNYTVAEVAVSAVIEGHGDHEGDIIPPFGDFSGLNWNEDTEAIWNNECAQVVIVPPNEACEIEGHKYNAAGNPLAGWTIGLMKVISHNLGVDQYDLVTAETDNDGYYCLEWDGESRELRPNTIATYVDGAYTFVYRVFEEIKAGWNNISIEKGPNASDLEVAEESEIQTDDTRTSVQIGEEGDYVYANAEYHVDFYNKEKSNEDSEDTYIVDGYKYFCDLEDEEWWNCEERLDGWLITATDGSTIATTTTDEDGYYSFELPAGDWTISEEDRSGWRQVYVWQNEDELYETSVCNFSFGEETMMGKAAKMVWEAEYTCDFGNTYYREQEYQLSGSKWNDLNANGVWDKDEPTLAGWTITASNGDDIATTTTDEDGDYELWVPAGTWTVSEVAQSDWTQTGVEKNGVPQEEASTCTFTVPDMELSSRDSEMSNEVWYSGTRCDFGNHKDEVVTEEEPKKKGSSGTRTKRPQGQVLGATTQCGLWLEDYMQKATENDTYQVLKLQVFLTLQGYATPHTGIFDVTTEANVKLFQAKYANTVIKPWFDKGIVPHNRPTGFVYKTTRWQINDIMCPGIEPYPSFEGENLSTNVLIKS